MKRKILLISSVLLTLIIVVSIVLIISKNNTNNEIYASNNEERKENSVGGFLTLMLETDFGSGQYQKSTSNTWPGEGYIFNENLSVCENGGKLSWNDELGAVNLKTNNSEKCYVYFDKEPSTLANYIINNVYTGTDGDNGLYYHDGQGTYTNADQEAGDNSYRYSGANPNNYVCFGSDEEICSEDNLYRIIGIFNDTGEYQTKLIKTTSYGEYPWNGSEYLDSNNWSDSMVNNDILNTEYLSELNTFKNMIVTHDWVVNGAPWGFDSVKTFFDYELGENSPNETYNAKIGLMYVSDYGYATSPSGWSVALTSYGYDTNASDNWLYLGSYEWTITKDSDSSSMVAIGVGSGGSIDGAAGVIMEGAIRPVFYLNSNVLYVSGDETQENPFRINYDGPSLPDSSSTIADVCTSGDKLNDCLIEYYNITGDMSGRLYYHDADLVNGAGDNSYRFAGLNPNNYVCFGTDAEICPEDNLYRIIGSFNNNGEYQVKLIKNTSIGNYAWDEGDNYNFEGDNTWDSNTKPDIRTTLNTTYLNTIPSIWQNKIANHSWKVGGMAYDSSYTFQQLYNLEVGDDSFSTTDTMKIGLIYVSDLVFSTSKVYWTLDLIELGDMYDNNIWINNSDIWTISRDSSSTYVWNVSSWNYISVFEASMYYNIHPCFYLISSITYESGSGTESDPIRIQ